MGRVTRQSPEKVVWKRDQDSSPDPLASNEIHDLNEPVRTAKRGRRSSSKSSRDSPKTALRGRRSSRGSKTDSRTQSSSPVKAEDRPRLVTVADADEDGSQHGAEIVRSPSKITESIMISDPTPYSEDPSGVIPHATGVELDREGGRPGAMDVPQATIEVQRVEGDLPVLPSTISTNPLDILAIAAGGVDAGGLEVEEELDAEGETDNESDALHGDHVERTAEEMPSGLPEESDTDESVELEETPKRQAYVRSDTDFAQDRSVADTAPPPTSIDAPQNGTAHLIGERDDGLSNSEDSRASRIVSTQANAAADISEPIRAELDDHSSVRPDARLEVQDPGGGEESFSKSIKEHEGLQHETTAVQSISTLATGIGSKSRDSGTPIDMIPVAASDPSAVGTEGQKGSSAPSPAIGQVSARTLERVIQQSQDEATNVPAAAEVQSESTEQVSALQMVDSMPDSLEVAPHAAIPKSKPVAVPIGGMSERQFARFMRQQQGEMEQSSSSKRGTDKMQQNEPAGSEARMQKKRKLGSSKVASSSQIEGDVRPSEGQALDADIIDALDEGPEADTLNQNKARQKPRPKQKEKNRKTGMTSDGLVKDAEPDSLSMDHGVSPSVLSEDVREKKKGTGKRNAKVSLRVQNYV